MNIIETGPTLAEEMRAGRVTVNPEMLARIIEVLRNHDASKVIVPAEISLAQFEQAIYSVLDIKIADLAALTRSNKVGDPATDKAVELMAMKIESATKFLRADVTPEFLAMLGKTEADADALWILGASM
jgi:hypothetical protein